MSNHHALLTSALAEKIESRPSILWRRTLLLLNLAPPLCVLLTGGTILWPWVLAIVFHGILLVGLLSPNSSWLGPILTKLPVTGKTIWLTIDDGPSADTIPLAKLLGEAGIHATFFLKGKEMAEHPLCLDVIRQYGHTVANHTETHRLAWFWIFPPSCVAHEVDAFISTAARYHAPLLPAFRCPAGVKNPFLHSILHTRKLTLVGWTVRAYDGVYCDAASGIRRVLSGLIPGAIILVHEGKTDRAGKPASIAFIQELIVKIQTAGYSFA